MISVQGRSRGRGQGVCSNPAFTSSVKCIAPQCPFMLSMISTTCPPSWSAWYTLWRTLSRSINQHIRDDVENFTTQYFNHAKRMATAVSTEPAAPRTDRVPRQRANAPTDSPEVAYGRNLVIALLDESLHRWRQDSSLWEQVPASFVAFYPPYSAPLIQPGMFQASWRHTVMTSHLLICSM